MINKKYSAQVLVIIVLLVAAGIAEGATLGSRVLQADKVNYASIIIIASDPIELKEIDSDGDEFNFSAAELDLFARIVHAESEGESFQGKVAVAASILNRIRSMTYPNTMSGVVYQRSNGYYQYSPVLDGRINRPAAESAKKAVQEALKGTDPSSGALGFYNPAKTSNYWVRSQPVTRIIGSHIFFK